MEKTEISTLSIGIKIKIKELIDAMTELNYKEIRSHFFTDKSIIEDNNSHYNLIYDSIVNGIDIIYENDYIEYINTTDFNFSEYKEYLVNNFKKFGYDTKNENEKCKIYENKDNKNSLYNQILLIPYNNLLSTERWGNSREGINGLSCKMDIVELNNISNIVNKKMEYLKISNYLIVFIVFQDSF
jgi:hypothetical protein